MTKMQRVRNVLLGLVMILLSFIMFLVPDSGYFVILMILSVSLIIAGIRYLIYYFSMARHMVGGKSALFIGVIALDLGILAYSLSDVPMIYVILYLLGTHIFSGMVDILRALEARRYGAHHWRLRFSGGVASILLGLAALICGICMQSLLIVVGIYCLGLVWAGIVRIISAFRRTSMVYIQ